MQKEELSTRVKEYKETIEKQEGQIEEMERRIKVLEADLEAAEDDSEENKKYANQHWKLEYYYPCPQETSWVGIFPNHIDQWLQGQGK